MSGEMRVLAEGSHSRVADAFLLVARDAETYAALRDLAGGLPEQSAEFFRTQAVVAAFLGTRRTGGYSVQIERAADGGVRVSESSPPADAMTTQALTSPFKVVSVSLGESETLLIQAAGAWEIMMRPYRVASGEFTMSGGIAGRAEQFQIEGELRVLRHGQLATFIFSLKSKERASERRLNGAATGIVQANGHVNIGRLGAGSFVEMPRSALRAAGQFAGNEDSLRLTLTSLPSMIADGFSGQGSLSATATAPAPPRSGANEGVLM